ncbi:ribosome maturation factor RimM [Tepidicella baoligensis]|uniref:ribosome maturation factor RimM n=1 Tax=Tepidicella baoligensis TaxID=2707016 RepID=UPI0015DBCA61|nr:ribosome maturation factor RimM [Tepidicella baoligensis]
MALVPDLNPAPLPADAVEVSRVQEAWGIKGWVRLHPYSADPEALFHARQWYLAPPEGRYARGFDAFTGTVSVAVAEIKFHGEGVVAQFDAISDRNAAESLKGARIYISRADFPATTDPDEFYWVDLMGLAVVNRQGVDLGVVRDLMPTGPHSVLVLEYQADGKPQERLIPFVSAYVDEVDKVARRITVDWQPDY